MTEAPNKKFSSKPWVFSGFVTVCILSAAFGGWAYATQISGAIITSGVVQGTNKTVIVQDIQGGKISDIYVTEGQSVDKNEKILEFNSDELSTEFIIVRDQLTELLAKRARLEAEVENSDSLDFTDLLSIAEADTVKSQMDAQRTIFRSLKDIIVKQIEQLDQRITQISSLIDGLEKQKLLLSDEIILVQELFEDQQKLYEKKLIQNKQIVALKRDLNQLQSQSASLSAEISKNGSSIAEIKLEILKLNAQTQQDALTEIRDQQFREMELKERYSRLKTKIKERTVLSPVKGEIFGLNFFNSGTVVRPAEEIMGIVPIGTSFVIEAKVSPIDIDEIYVNQTVRINFPSIERSEQIDLYSSIKDVSADAFDDERSGQTYFKATINLPETEITKLPSNFKIRPGMIAETYILKSERSVISYLTDPLSGFFDKAFRE